MDAQELKSKLHLLEIPITDLGSVTQLPGHVRAKWASQGTEGERSGSLQSIEAKLDRAERKREEFRSWVTDKARTRSRVSQTSDERRAKHLQRLQDRLVLAEHNRLNTLEAVKLKAAAEQVKLDAVVSKLNELLERKAQKIDEGLKAAERRRQALLEAEKERLNAAHELVLARLVSAQERGKQDVSAKQRAIENRLQQAGEIRHQHLAERAARASEKVARAKQVSTLARRLAQQDAQQRITSWRAKLEGAAERRQNRQARPEPEHPKRGATRAATRQGKPVLSEAERERLSVIHHSMRARHVQNMWRSFVKRRKTTAALVHNFVATNITGLRLPDSPQRSVPASGESDGSSSAVASDSEAGRDRPVMIGGISVVQSPVHTPFEEFAAKLQAAGTLKMAQTLLRRLEYRLQARGTADKSCAALLRRLFPRAPRNSNIERYPTRVFLCAYMIVRHPEIVFNGTGERERSLSAAAKDLLFAFELLLQRILEPPPTPLAFSPNKTPNTSAPGSADGSPKGSTTSSPGSSATGSPQRSTKGSPTTRGTLRGTLSSTPKGSTKGSPQVSSKGSPSVSMSGCSSPAVVASPSNKSRSVGSSINGSPASSAPASRMDSPRSLSSPTPARKVNPPVVPPSPLKEGMQAYRAAMKLKLRGSVEGVKAGGGQEGQGEKSASEFITIGQLLVQFDEAWLSYLDQFVAWKSHDAASLEQELIRMAAKLETSMRRKVGVSIEDTEEFERRVSRSEDLQAMVAQVKYDHELLRERIGKLGGQQGLTRLEEALEAARNLTFGGMSTASDSQPGSDVESTASSSRRNSHGTESEWETDGVTTPSSMYIRPDAVGRAANPKGQSSPGMSPDTLHHLAQTRASLLATTNRATGADRPPRPSTAPAAVEQRSFQRITPSPPATPTPAVSQPTAPPKAPVGTGLREWSAMHAAALTNEQMVWELVYNPEFQLPMNDAEAAWRGAVLAATSTAPSRGDPMDMEPPPSPTNFASAPETALATIRARARQQAERAFWDSVESSVQQGLMHGGAAAVAARLVSDLAGTLVELMADPNRAAAVHRQFAEAELTQQLQATQGASLLAMGGLDVMKLLQVLDSLGNLLSVMGAPSHEVEVKAAHARMAEQLAFVVGGGISGEEGAEKLAKAVCRVLRLMWSQLSLMKIQAANARLRGVAVALQSVGAVRYLRDKFRRAHSLPVAAPVAPEPSGEEPAEGHLTPPLLSEKLPRTCAWFNSTVDTVLPVLQRLQAASLQLPSEAVLGNWLSSSTSAPVRMASGRGPAVRSPSGVWPENSGPATNPVLPVQPMSWRGRVRCGLVHLISSSTPAASERTPEVLQWDSRRLHEAQNRFQQLLVCTASLLIAQQMRAARSLHPWTPMQQQEAKHRLLLTLEDPAMKLPDLIGLLSLLAGASTTAEEMHIRTAFTRIIDPSASAFQVMGVALSHCLSLLVTCSPNLLELSINSNSVSNSPAASPSPYATTPKEGLGALSPSAGLTRVSPAARAAAPAEVMDFAAALKGLLAKGGSVILAAELASLASSILTMAAVVEAVHEEVFSALDDEI